MAQRQASVIASNVAQLLSKGNLQAAAISVGQGLSLAPNHPDLLHLAGQVSLHTGNRDESKRLIRRAIKVAPKIGLYHYSLAAALFAENDLDGALQSLRAAIRLEPRNADAYTNLGIVFVRKKQHDEAEAAFSQAARLKPDDPQVHLNLAICNMELKEPQKAAAAVRKVEELVQAPEPRLLFQIGNVYRGLGQSSLAESYYHRALERQSEAPDMWFEFGDLLLQTGEYDRAAEALSKADVQGYDSIAVDIAMARVHAALGEIDQARALLDSATAKAGDKAVYLYDVARQFTFIGDFAAQERCLHRVLELEPDHAGAFAALLIAPGRKLTDGDVAKLRKLADDKSVDSETRRRIGFSLGNHYRYAKQYDESFRYYRLGNRLRGNRFDREAYARWVASVESTFTADFFEQRATCGSDSRLPVLIVGMPRSGTTLTEQIISSHPSVFGAGEYGYVSKLCSSADLEFPDPRAGLDRWSTVTCDETARHAEIYLEKMQALTQRGETKVTNKLPHNFEQLGVFGMLFPQAPIIHVKRDPRDNLLSIYFQDFSEFHDYATDLKSLGHYFCLYERLMAHWLEVVPNPVYTLQYEDLVADLPTKARELADFVGIGWDERMLSYYDQERKVDTASKWQVRQPIYQSSVSRWTPYAKHLKPLFDVLDQT